jgi:hypothetical protein
VAREAPGVSPSPLTTSASYSGAQTASVKRFQG